MALAAYRSDVSYDQLSLRDLLDAREQYHVHLMQHPNVVATAVGRYRIRQKDSWPNEKGEGKVHGQYARTLENSEVRFYSWPAILAFVEKWESPADLAKRPGALVPKTLYLPDGRRVPVCVIEAPKEDRNEVFPLDPRQPLNNLGGGSAVVTQVQGREYAATIACLVSDGHKVYALTNRHVAGEAGEAVYATLDGRLERVGESSEKQLTRLPFTALYPGWPGRDVYVNADVGLIDVDDVAQWTANIRNVGQMGKMVDLSVHNLSLALIGTEVCGTGAASGAMQGEIAALFYRYKTNGGFEYVADLMIGPRPRPPSPRKGASPSLATHPGDSGTLWLLEPVKDAAKENAPDDNPSPEYLPLAMQWGRNMLYSAGSARPQSYVLATLLSRVCAELGVDPVRNWNIDQPDTWGGIGHFSIAARAQVALSGRYPRLDELMSKNALIISHDDAAIIAGDFVGMGSADFVALADVPDFFWKPGIAKQGFSRQYEGPNHFADMDQPDSAGETLLDLCTDKAFIDPSRWDDFYSTVTDLMTGEPIPAKYRGLLPFRVWQIFDEMVRAVAADEMPQFVCAAGTLTHYIADACQPLHISYLHNGDPLRAFEYTFKKGEKKGQKELRPLGTGVHAAYENDMISASRKDVLSGLSKTSKTKKAELIENGFAAAQLTIDMMRTTYEKLPPMEIVDTFASFNGKPKDRSVFLWKEFGDRTIEVMQGGAHLLAVLWESAWVQSDGENAISSIRALTKKEAMKICGKPDFIPSMTIDRIGEILSPPPS